MSIRATYLKLPVAAKLLFPLLSVFLGLWTVWTVGSFSFFRGYLQQSLRQKTEDLSLLVLEDLKQKQELLRLQARWVADRNDVSQAVASRNKTLLLQTLLPVQATLKLNQIKVVDTDGSVLVDLRQGAVSQAKLQDEKVSRAASIGMEFSDVVSAQGVAPSVLVGLISIKSQKEVLGGVIVGSELNNELLNQIRGSTDIHLVAFEDSQIIASTLPKAFHATWLPPTPESPPLRLTIAKEGYIAKTVVLTGVSGTTAKVVLLTSVASWERAEQRLWLSIGGFCLLGQAIALGVGIWVTRLLTRRIQTLTNATQQLADGDFTTRIKVDSNDEIGILAQGFNFMAEQLTARDQQINFQMQQLESTLQKLKQTQAQLVQSEKMSSLGQMVAGIAHEINNPTSFIHGNLTYLREYTQDLLQLVQLYQQHYPNPAPEIQEEIATIELNFLQEDLLKLLNSMEVGSDRIREIVLSLRNFSRLDQAEFKKVNLHEGIDSTLMILTNRFKAHPAHPKIKVIKEYGQLPLVECYPGQLNQVFMNILVNAIDALEEMGRWDDRAIRSKEKIPIQKFKIQNPEIRITTQALDKDWIAIYIADNGLGMTEEICSKLFDPFFTTKPVGKGTGLGLSISYQIVVEKHGGKLECYSEPGQGTVFVIQIPIGQVKSVDIIALAVQT
ncbi:sensor histidine kinase [Mastigocladopsis repens]|uniref:sensor histidine kinase n=1 Tax=Mastigocladopsis repens TaxID=221287 RepID=UPI0002DFBCA2|nr:ATP-binding protein [Mastigocladopsis repens]